MKIRHLQNHQRGSVLASTLVLAGLVGIVVGALLLITRQQNYLTARSQTWCSEIPIAEAGIEEAMAHINSKPTNFASHGWAKNGTGSSYFQQRSIGSDGGYYYVTISTGMPPQLTSIGYARIPLQTNFTHRTVLILTKRAPPGWGLVGKNSVTLSGTPYVDSYDSSDPTYSTLGKWDITKRRDRSGVGTLGTAKPAITQKGTPSKIYGSAATGPGGTVNATVGDGSWIAAGNSGAQAGHVTDDFNMAIPDVSLPSPWNPQTVVPYNPLTGTYTVSGGQWQFDGNITVSSGVGVVVTGNAVIYFNGNFAMSGTPSITLAPGATLEMYMGGSMSLKGNCVVNPTGIPANCLIYGLPTCTTMTYTGNAEAYCKLYAPQADLTITGDFDFSGSALGKTVTLSGTANFHYDEALNTAGPEYKINSWEEL